MQISVNSMLRNNIMQYHVEIATTHSKLNADLFIINSTYVLY